MSRPSARLSGYPSLFLMTSSWFTPLDPNRYQRVGISRGVPRNAAAGYRRYTKLNPGPWFNSVSPDRYLEPYNAEVLGVLEPSIVVDELHAMADGKIPVMLCFEPATPGEQWCHRGIVAAWLFDNLGLEVCEYGQEKEGFGWSHPKLHPSFRRPADTEMKAGRRVAERSP